MDDHNRQTPPIPEHHSRPACARRLEGEDHRCARCYVALTCRSNGECRWHQRRPCLQDSAPARERPMPMKMQHERFESRIRKVDECWLWMGPVNRHGHGTMKVGSRTDGTRKSVNVRRWAYRFYNAPIEPGIVVFADCRTRGCVNPDHLKTGTRSQCQARYHRLGLIKTGNVAHFPKDQFGENNPATKLPDAAVQSIRAQKGKTKQIVLALRHHVSEATISLIWRNKSRTRATPQRFASSKGLTTQGTIRPPARIEEADISNQGEYPCSIRS